MDVPKVTISGGNGTPSSVSVNMKNIDHSVDFFADGSSAQVGLGTTGTIGQTIGFSTFHKFKNGERVIYDSVNQLGVGGMSTNAEYYVSTFVEEGNAKQSFTKIKLYPTSRDALAGINTVELTSFGVGKQSLRSFDQKSVIAGVNVVSGGVYENKQRKVAAATGVSTSKNEIIIKDHDYKDGEIIKYTAGDNGIIGLTDGSEYYVLKIDDDKFKLANVGVGTTNGVDYFYQSGQYVGLSSIGSGTHTFNYPDITVTVSGNVGVASTGLETFQANVQPIIRGQITSVNLDNQGSGYGSGEIINHNRKPEVTLISGSQAEILPIVVDGKITEVVVLNDKVWIPVEATLVGKPFFSAWKQGALKYNEMKAEDFVNEISVKEASAKYIAGSHITPDMPMPIIDGINDLLKEDIKQYGMWLEQIVYNAVGNSLTKAEDYYDAGVKYMEFGRYKEAIEMLETSINMKPVFPDAINTLGVCYTKKEKYTKAIEFYEKALGQSGEHAGYMLNIAIAHFMMGNKGMAKQKYNEVILIDPVFAGKLDKVFGAAKASLSPPSNEGSKLSISVELEAELEAGSSKGLVEVKDSPVDIEPENIKKVNFRKQRARSDNTVGVTFARLGNYSMAIDYFKKAVSNDDEELDYKVNLAVSLYRMYEYEEAISYYEEVKKAKPELVTQLDFIESMGESTPKFEKFD